MQKMIKTGFRGKKKTPPPPPPTRGGGECSDGKDELANEMGVTQEEDNDKLKTKIFA